MRSKIHLKRDSNIYILKTRRVIIKKVNRNPKKIQMYIWKKKESLCWVRTKGSWYWESKLLTIFWLKTIRWILTFRTHPLEYAECFWREEVCVDFSHVCISRKLLKSLRAGTESFLHGLTVQCLFEHSLNTYFWINQSIANSSSVKNKPKNISCIRSGDASLLNSYPDS